MASNNKNNIKKKQAKKPQTNKKPKKMSNKEKAKFSEQNQIDWFPIDPYCD